MSVEQDFNETAREIERILKFKGDVEATFGRNGAPLIYECFEIIKRDLGKCLKDETIQATDIEVNKVKQMTDMFLGIGIDRELTPIFRDLSIVLMKLTYNWSVNVAHCPDIERQAKFIDRIARNSMTMLDTIWILQQLIQRARSMKDYEPPAFALARHYLNSLEAKKKDPIQ